MYRSIVVLTGAGVSAESGVDTFRDTGGLWEKYRVEDVASPEGFSRDPELVYRFYNLRRRKLLSGQIQPNEAHRALSQLEARFPGDFLLVTQNVDDLHERAGSRELIHMHGELLRARCSVCDVVREVKADIGGEDVCAGCDRTGTMRPHVVWFGEMPLEMERIIARLERCDLFLSVGTSGHVYPAAGFVEIAADAGAHTIELNLDKTEVASAFHRTIRGRATETVPRLVDELLSVSR